MKMLIETVGETPEKWTIEGEGEFLVYSKHPCILDAYSDVRVLKEIGWKNIQVHPIT